MSQIGFYFNQMRCSGCKTCQISCKDKNRLDAGPILREVRSYQVGTYPNAKMYHVSASCNHCDVPACKDVCPVGAYEKLDDGTVLQDPERCIGCSSCVNACPYDAPRLDESVGVTRKCDSCIELRKEGYEPACVEACPYRALAFGEVAELAEKYDTEETASELPALLLDNQETGPNTLINPRPIAKQEVGTRITL